MSGLQFYYEEEGTGLPLVLLGSAVSAVDSAVRGGWGTLRPYLAQRYRVVHVDQRGHGRTNNPGGATAYSYATLVADAAALIDQLGLAPAHVAGFSHGGSVGLGLVLHHPARVRSLIGVGTNYTNDAKALAALPSLDPDRIEQKSPTFAAALAQRHDPHHGAGWPAGSHDFTVADAFVPAERTLVTTLGGPQGRALARGPLYAFGLGVMPITLATAALGIARGAIDALADLAGAKTPRAGGGTLLRDQPVAQHRVGVAEADLRASRALLLETVRDVWAAVYHDGPITARQRTLLRWASGHATAMAARAVDTAWELAGGSAIFAGSPLERRFRDVHIVTQHFVVNQSRYAEGGRLFLGLDA